MHLQADTVGLAYTCIHTDAMKAWNLALPRSHLVAGF